jgi:hypothetical protein
MVEFLLWWTETGFVARKIAVRARIFNHIRKSSAKRFAAPQQNLFKFAEIAYDKPCPNGLGFGDTK